MKVSLRGGGGDGGQKDAPWERGLKFAFRKLDETSYRAIKKREKEKEREREREREGEGEREREREKRENSDEFYAETRSRTSRDYHAEAKRQNCRQSGARLL